MKRLSIKHLVPVLASSFLMTSSHTFAGVCNNPDNQILKTFNAIATTTSHYVGFILDMWVDQKIDFSLQTIDKTTNCSLFDAKIGCNQVKNSPLIQAVEVDDLTGEIYTTFQTGKHVHPLLRGAAITLTPLYCQSSAASIEICSVYDNRKESSDEVEENEPTQNQIKPTKWQCLLEGPQSDFRNFTLSSVTCNFLSESTSNYKRLGNTLNVLKDVCGSASYQKLGD